MGFQNVADTPDGADKIGLPVLVQSLSQSAYVDVQCALFYMMQTWPHRTHELRPPANFGRSLHQVRQHSKFQWSQMNV